jgi:hypothetical protein
MALVTKTTDFPWALQNPIGPLRTVVKKKALTLKSALACAGNPAQLS